MHRHLIDSEPRLRTGVVMMFLKVLFWIALAFDAGVVGLIFVLGLAAAGPSHTNPLEVIFKLLLIPAVVLVALAVWFVMVPAAVSRLVAFAIVVSPLALVAVGGVMTGVSTLVNPQAANMSTKPVPLNDLQNAVLNNDLAGVQRTAAVAKLKGRDDTGGVLILSLNRIAKSPDQLPVLQALLDAGANANYSYGTLPLEHAIDSKVPQAALMLIRAGADPNKTNALGDPVLFAALKPEVDLAMLKLLLDNGGNSNVKSFRGESALAHAQSLNNKAAAQMLSDRGAK